MNIMIISGVVVLIILIIGVYFMFRKPVYKGCYKDSANRVLKENLGTGSLTECQKLAKDKNMKYYGLQFVNGHGPDGLIGECWGGNDLVSQGVATNCMKNKNNEMVGQDWSLGIYAN